MEQENTDILNNGNKKTSPKNLWTIKLLIVGGAMIAITFLLATFWEDLGLTSNETVWLALSMMVAFGINLAGFIIGFFERNKNAKRALYGIIGNIILVLVFVLIVAYSFSTTSDVNG